MSSNTKRLLLINVASKANGKDSQAPSSLDHVFASEHLKFRESAPNVEVEVRGWANKTADEKNETGSISFLTIPFCTAKSMIHEHEWVTSGVRSTDFRCSLKNAGLTLPNKCASNGY
jgi:hypothetical protein